MSLSDFSDIIKGASMRLGIDTAGSLSYQDRRNITVGQGRILYAQSATDINGNFHAEGFVLPGGERTLSEARAYQAALLLDQLSRP